jgi:hypothetical protein
MLKQGQKQRLHRLIRQASDKYSEGLAILHEATSDAHALKCALHSNSALAQGLLGNFRNSLDAARCAIKCDAQHLKSYFRAAQAAVKLKRWAEGQELCESGLKVEVGAPELTALLAVCQRERASEAERQRRAVEAEEARLEPYRRTAAYLMAQGYRMTRPQFGFQKNSDGAAIPHLGDDGRLHFPVMLYYPEATPYHDTVEDACEDDVIGSHLDEVRSHSLRIHGCPCSHAWP